MYRSGVGGHVYGANGQTYSARCAGPIVHVDIVKVCQIGWTCLSMDLCVINVQYQHHRVVLCTYRTSRCYGVCNACRNNHGTRSVGCHSNMCHFMLNGAIIVAKIIRNNVCTRPRRRIPHTTARKCIGGCISLEGEQSGVHLLFRHQCRVLVGTTPQRCR
ncbi:hypothetical protein ORF047R [Spotted knifejaw iridovirus]|nr:hypothetical protein ORF047R [Spotted knifejaw iridovirus]